MKYLIPILTLGLCAGCATHKPSESKTVVAASGLSRKEMVEVRTPEIVKAYPVGRYTDPNFPDEMHERHTVYRREESSGWNYQPNASYALPMGPTVAKSNPSPGYYVQTDEEQRNAQQKAYAEALLEQNRAMKKRVEELQQEAAKVPELRQEVERLKTQTTPDPSPSPSPAKASTDDAFSFVEPSLPEEEGISDPCEIVLFAEDDDQSQAFLVSQMRLNDEFATELEALERRKHEAAVNAPFLRRREVALLTQ